MTQKESGLSEGNLPSVATQSSNQGARETLMDRNRSVPKATSHLSNHSKLSGLTPIDFLRAFGLQKDGK